MTSAARLLVPFSCFAVSRFLHQSANKCNMLSCQQCCQQLSSLSCLWTRCLMDAPLLYIYELCIPDPHLLRVSKPVAAIAAACCTRLRLLCR